MKKNYWGLNELANEFQDVSSIRQERQDLKWLITIQIQACLESARKPVFKEAERSEKFLVMRSNLQMLEGLLWSKLRFDSVYLSEKKKIINQLNITPPEKSYLLDWFKILCTKLHYFGLVEAVPYTDYIQHNEARAMDLVDKVVKLAKDSPHYYNLFADELENQLKENKDLIEAGDNEEEMPELNDKFEAEELNDEEAVIDEKINAVENKS